MDFFTAQDKAHRTSKWLVVYFIIAVILICTGVYFTFYAGEVLFFGAEGNNVLDPVRLWDTKRLLWTVLGCLLVIGINSYLKVLEYSKGGGHVAQSLGGRKVDPATQNIHERRLVNVVEEMAIASGIPVPEVYILDHEPGINAFAAGNTYEDAAVAVTRGSLEAFNRDELQGVVAHEFSHILNGDMRLNLRMAGIIYGILCVSILGSTILRIVIFSGGGSDSRRGKGEGGGAVILPFLVVGVSLYLIGLIGSIFGRLIQAGISRQREYLADASAVQFTRNPEGISGALRKIGGASERGRMEQSGASGLAHLFFANAMNSAFLGIFATHPPLEKRIQAVDPSWDGTFSEPRRERIELSPSPAKERERSARERLSNPLFIVSAIGTLDAEAAREARNLMAQLPQIFQRASRDPETAIAVLISLLLDDDEDIIRKQLEAARAKGYGDLLGHIEEVAPEVKKLSAGDRLPVLELCLPTLKQGMHEDNLRLGGLLRELAAADHKVTLFEFVLEFLFRKRVGLPVVAASDSIERHASGPPLYPAMSRVCTALAFLDTDDEDEARQRVARAVKGLYIESGVSLVDRKSLNYSQLACDLEQMRHAIPGMRKIFLQVCAKIVMTDEQVSVEEAELFRAIAIGMDCPVPLLRASA